MYNSKVRPGERYWNMFFVSMAMFIAGYVMFQLGRWEAREKPDQTSEFHLVQDRAPELFGQLHGEPELSEDCMILLPPEVSEEPRYRIGRGEECRP